MVNLVGIVTGVLVAIAAAIAAATKVFRNVGELRTALKRHVTVIGVVSGEAIPATLQKYRDFTSLEAGLTSGESVVLYHCFRLSHALKVCDFVIWTDGCDPKIKAADDPFWETLN